MVPTQIKNPKPSYCLLIGKGVIAVYFPLIFVSISWYWSLYVETWSVEYE